MAVDLVVALASLDREWVEVELTTGSAAGMRRARRVGDLRSVDDTSPPEPYTSASTVRWSDGSTWLVLGVSVGELVEAARSNAQHRRTLINADEAALRDEHPLGSTVLVSRAVGDLEPAEALEVVGYAPGTTSLLLRRPGEDEPRVVSPTAVQASRSPR